MNAAVDLVRAEWTKLLSTKVFFWLLLVAALMGGGFTALFTALAGAQNGLPPVGSPEFTEVVAGVPAQVAVIPLVLGIIGMTQEYRHRTATPTFLVTPRRGRVVVAKLLAYAVAGVAVAAVVVAVTVAVASGYGSARGAAPDWTADTLGTLGRSGLALVVFAVIGVGVGALVRNQVGAVVGSLVYLFVVESIIASIPATADAYRFLPGGALAAMTGTGGGGGIDLLTAWQGGLLLLGYGLVAAVLGTVLAVRRDVV
ncbi:ABC-type transport system involved in multi-copper enzyme maturation, permease component [Klenkia marina]|uniref:ABC-type transport system involved in multi-copper enzyme maturation, permease component n=1 Tax=Klenkia marina TaxID=1960309 RepID=A0A1G4YFY7_9ACTN|nr:ABC transporter permease [Klenkia marina]SCX52372.1 ABC-type transport system involved in multi-copper enzyme maturation, permease component [Klenkia marina]